MASTRTAAPVVVEYICACMHAHNSVPVAWRGAILDPYMHYCSGCARKIRLCINFIIYRYRRCAITMRRCAITISSLFLLINLPFRNMPCNFDNANSLIHIFPYRSALGI